MIDLDTEFEGLAARASIVTQIAVGNMAQRFDAIAAYYRAIAPDINAVKPFVWAVDPYEVDWFATFTPIERSLWADIRAEGAVLYPQFPVGGFFVDFGHPVARVAIECDGERFHRDKEKDARRQKTIESMGWKVFRISGSDCHSDFVEHEKPNSNASYLVPGGARNLIRQVAREFGLSAKRCEMPRDQAHQILNAAKAGQSVVSSDIYQALLATGDLDHRWARHA